MICNIEENILLCAKTLKCAGMGGPRTEKNIPAIKCNGFDCVPNVVPCLNIEITDKL